MNSSLGSCRGQTTEMYKASKVIDLYNDGKPDPWTRALKIYPELRTLIGNKNQTVADALLAWAVGVVTKDEVKRGMSARVLQALASIGFDETERATDRLNALKLLGNECGMFGAKTDLNGKIVIEKIQRTIVDLVTKAVRCRFTAIVYVTERAVAIQR